MATIAVNAKAEKNMTRVRILVRHPTETGLRRDKLTDSVVPMSYIKEVRCAHAGKSLLTAFMGPWVAENPVLEFKFKGGQPGETLTVTWVDNSGKTETFDGKII